MLIEKILLVDDDSDLRRIGQLSLSNVGKWAVTLACSGQEALKLACDAEPDVILLDVMMPDMDGPTTLHQLKSNRATAHIPVIFLSAKVQVHEIDDYISLGAAGVIIKPFDPMTLPDEIRQLVGQTAETVTREDLSDDDLSSDSIYCGTDQKGGQST